MKWICECGKEIDCNDKVSIKGLWMNLERIKIEIKCLKCYRVMLKEYKLETL